MSGQLSQAEIYQIVTSSPSVQATGSVTAMYGTGEVAVATGPPHLKYQNNSFYGQNLRQKVAQGMSTPASVYEVMNAAAQAARVAVFSGTTKVHR